MAMYFVENTNEEEVVDTVNEEVVEEQTEENDSVLDGILEACDYMMDLLNESKARQKYIDARVKEAERDEKLADYAKNVHARFNTQKTAEDAEAARRKANISTGKAVKYAAGVDTILNSDEEIGCGRSVKKLNKDYSYKNYNNDPRKLARYSEEKFRKDFGIPQKGNTKDTSPIGTREPGTVKKLQDQKRAIKETCLNILAVLDDIDN